MDYKPVTGHYIVSGDEVDVEDLYSKYKVKITSILLLIIYVYLYLIQYE